MTTLEVRSVETFGTIAVGYVVDARGVGGAIAIEPRMAADLQTALDRHERPMVAVEDWQLLPGFQPGPGSGL